MKHVAFLITLIKCCVLFTVTYQACAEKITVTTLWSVHRKFMMVEDLTVNMGSHKDDKLTLSILSELPLMNYMLALGSCDRAS